MDPIPFNQPPTTGRELEYLQQAIASHHLHGDGPFTHRCQDFLQDRYGCPRALLTHSCTGALEMAALLCDLQPGDEFIVPSYTFVSSVNAFVQRGAIPVWCDLRPDTLNMDEQLIEPLITTRTKAIVPMHYGGVACEMDTIMDIAGRHGLLVIEDAAQGIEAFYNDRPLGTIGHLGCLSFHGTKNVVAGEGGALLINDAQFVARAEIIREKGTNRSQFIRGEVDKYTWVDHGSSYLPSELTAAFLLAQLEEVAPLTRRRLDVWNKYDAALKDPAKSERLSIAQIPAQCRPNGHLFYILLPDVQQRDHVMQTMKRQNIHTTFHYVPLHTSPAAARFGAPHSLPVTEDIWQRLLRLPLYADLQPKQIDRVIETLLEALT